MPKLSSIRLIIGNIRRKLSLPSLILLTILVILLAVAILFTFHGSAQSPTATVVFFDTSETILAQAELQISDTMITRYIGLSQTTFLGKNQGMLFVHPSETNHVYVMRNMSFPIDIIFIDSQGTIVSIHHAHPELPPYTPYEGLSKWVIELPYNWTLDHNISPGDTVHIYLD